MGFSKQQQIILLLLGLTVFCIDLFRPYHPFWSPSPASTHSTTQQPGSLWMIEVTGAVTNPGIYVFHSPTTATEAVQRAGGHVNQGSASSGRVQSPLKTGTRVEVGASATNYDRLPISPMEPAKKFVLGIPFPLNQADAEALAMIPGISKNLAHRIVAYRDANGPFKRWNDLRAVSGIGPKKVQAFRSYLILR